VALYDQLQHSVEQALVGFQQLTAASIFYVPPAAPPAPEGADPAAAAALDTSHTPQEEQELDQQLQQLRQQILQVGGRVERSARLLLAPRCRRREAGWVALRRPLRVPPHPTLAQARRGNQQLRSSINHLERDIMTAGAPGRRPGLPPGLLAAPAHPSPLPTPPAHPPRPSPPPAAGSNPQLDALAASLGAHQEGLQGDLLAIAAAAEKLQPLLQRALHLRGSGGADAKEHDGGSRGRLTGRPGALPCPVPVGPRPPRPLAADPTPPRPAAAVAERELRVRQQGAKSGLAAEAAAQLNDLLAAP
jgi:hypothetical protein